MPTPGFFVAVRWVSPPAARSTRRWPMLVPMGPTPVAGGEPGTDTRTSRIVDRGAAVGVIAAATAVAWALARIEPKPKGHGTHELLGLGPCRFALEHGAPCPTCGVTTAACHLVHLQPLRALYVQPFGALLAAAGIVLALYALVCLVRRQPFLAGLARLPCATLAFAGLAAFLLGWGWKLLTFEP